MNKYLQEKIYTSIVILFHYNTSMTTQTTKQSSLGVNRLCELQSSIKSMKSRIQSLLKFQSTNQRSIKQTLKSSIHHLGHKIVQTEYTQTLRKTKQSDKQRIKQQHKEIIEFRQRQNQELERIKETMKMMKRNESEIIKKQSRLNDGVIRENRRKNIEEKKENVEKMKEIKEETRRSMVQRWKENAQNVLESRWKNQKESRVKEELILESKIKELQRIEKELAQKVEESNETSKTLHQVAEDTNNLSQVEFYKIIKQVKRQKKVTNSDELKNQIYQKFLATRMAESFKTRSTFKSASQNSSTVLPKSIREDRGQTKPSEFCPSEGLESPYQEEIREEDWESAPNRTEVGEGGQDTKRNELTNLQTNLQTNVEPSLQTSFVNETEQTRNPPQ